MLKQQINELVKIILIDNTKDSVISILNNTLKMPVEQTMRYGYFCRYLDEFIGVQNNSEYAMQMEYVIKNIKKDILNEIEKLNLDVIEDLKEYLDNELKIMDIPKEVQKPLQENLIQYIKYYIYKIDKRFYNDIFLYDKLMDHEDIITKLQEWCNETTEIIKTLENNIPVIMGTFHLDIQNYDKIDLRECEISAIQNKFKNGNNVVYLYGKPGIGKTTLARLYANRYCDKNKRKNMVYFIKYDVSIENTISKLSVDNDKYKGEDVLKYWETLNFEERKHILLIIDNFNENTLQGGSKKSFQSEITGTFFEKLKDLGIHILITTRIKVNEDVYEVLAVNDTISLFERYFGSVLQEKDRQSVEQIINLLQCNTMLIILLAHLWKKSNPSEKEHLLNKIINCEIHEYTKELTKEADAEVDDLTIYGQVSALLDLSGILKDDAVKEVFVNVALLPLTGLMKNTFNEFINYLDGNILESLIMDSWVLEEDNKVFLHPIVREIVRKNGYVRYEICKNYCRSIKEVISKDKKTPKHVVRLVYKDCAWEIFKMFSSRESLDINLVDLFYWLSDICDELSERSKSLEIAKIILKHLDVYNGDKLIKAGRMSGIAYSMNNSYKNMEDLDEAENLLCAANKVYAKIEEIKDEIQYRRVGGKLLNNFGSNYISRSNCNRARKNEFLKIALSWQKRALEHRKNLEMSYILEPIETINAIKSDIATSYTSIATTYFYFGQYEEAISNHSKAEIIRRNLDNIKSMNDNQERIIGCIIQMYRDAFSLDKCYLQRALDYYPKLLESNYENQANKALKINVNNFLLIARIILYDKRFLELYDELIEKYNLIIGWAEENLLLEAYFDISFKELITEMNTNKIYVKGEKNGNI